MKKILLLGFCLCPLPAWAVTVIVPAGDVVDGGDIHTVVTQQVYGEANNFTVSGVQQVMNGGVTHNSSIYPNGTQTVESGGTSYNTSVLYTGLQNVNGKSYNSTLSGGTIDVNAGGYAEGTTVGSGSFYISAGGTARDTVLNSGMQYVSGTDYNTVINGGEQEVRSGGMANGTKVSGGTQRIEAGGRVENAVVSGDGIQEVYGSAAGTVIENGGTMRVAGSATASGTRLESGTMDVEYDARSENTVINSGSQYVYGVDSGSTVNGGEQYVSYEGKSENATVQNAGVQYLSYGSSSVGAHVLNGGLQQVTEEALASRTVVDNGGKQEIQQGGTASRSVVYAGGMQDVFGVSESSVINGGLQTVQSGGKSSGDEVLGSGLQQILSGGTAVSAVIARGGRQEIAVQARAEQSIVEAGGIQQVYGTSLNARINGGSQYVFAGGRSVNDTVGVRGVQIISRDGTAEQAVIMLGGSQEVSGMAAGTHVNGGVQSILDGGSADSSLVSSGSLEVLNGGTALNAVLTGGVLALHEGGRLTGITRADNAQLNVYGSNDIPDLELSGTRVNMVYDGSYATLKVNTLNGTGFFNLNTNLADNISNQLEIHEGSGEFGLVIHDYSMDSVFPDRFRVINEDALAADNFYLVGNAVDVGAFHYSLQQDGNDWFLQRTSELTDTSIIAKNTFSSLASLFYTHLSPVYNRMRTGHKASEHEQSLWIKGLGQKIKIRFKDGSKSHTDVYGGEIGFDHDVWHWNGNHLKLGIYSGYTSSKQVYDLEGRGNGYTRSIGLYSTLMTAGNWFVDMVGTYFRHRQKITSYSPSGADIRGKYTIDGWQGSVFAGYRYDFAAGWFLEPSLGINYMHVNKVNYRTNYNTLIDASGADYLSGRTGFAAGKEFVLAAGTILDAYGRFNLIHDWDGKSTVQVADYRFREDVSDTRYELGIGLNASWHDSSLVYVEAATHLGSRIQLPWEINLGVQFNF